MRYLFALSALFCIPKLLGGTILLDEVMSVEEQTQTGVAYLTPKQRVALEQWLNVNCNCPSRIAPHKKEKKLYVSINIDSGRMIQLNDNTIWEVDPRDQPISEAWLSSIPIKIVPSDDPDFPYLLVNKNDGISIRVKQGEAPPALPYHARPPVTPSQGATGAPAPTPPPTSPPSSSSTIPRRYNGP